jgi:hypothetical protein
MAVLKVRSSPAGHEIVDRAMRAFSIRTGKIRCQILVVSATKLGRKIKDRSAHRGNGPNK